MFRKVSWFALGLALAGSSAPAVRAAEGVQTAYSRQDAESENDASGDEVRARMPGERDWRYRRQNGQWWYWAGDEGWMRWDGSRWVAGASRRTPSLAMPDVPANAPGALEEGIAAERKRLDAGQAPETPGFNRWFSVYRGFQTGLTPLTTAEEGAVELGTSEISGEAEASELAEFGGIPKRQVRRHAGMGRTISGGGAWFNAGSPFGIKYGYGSGYGYGGYGFDNPYGYGSRSGSGGAFGYGFGAYGSVGGQTGERLSSLITGNAEAGRLIGSEPPSIGAPARLEGPVGGTSGRAGSGSRSLGGSAAGD